MLSSYSGRGISGIAGGITLVVSLLLFSNATWSIKVALVVTYTILNLLYWLASILPLSWSWHLGFEIKEEKPILNNTYTRALWSAIWVSQRVDWVLKSDAAPNTAVWRDWIEEAENALHRPREGFDPQKTLSRLLDSHKRTSIP
jgi:hypothetical protein